MQHMSSRYQNVSVEHDVRPWMKTSGGKIFYWQAGGQEAVMTMQFNAKRGIYRVNHIGFVGERTEEVLTAIHEKLSSLLPGTLPTYSGCVKR